MYAPRPGGNWRRRCTERHPQKRPDILTHWPPQELRCNRTSPRPSPTTSMIQSLTPRSSLCGCRPSPAQGPRPQGAGHASTYRGATCPLKALTRPGRRALSTLSLGFSLEDAHDWRGRSSARKTALHPHTRGGLPRTNMNSKWVKGLHARPKTIKLLEENKGEKLHDTGLGSDFLDMMSKAQATKGKTKGTT